MSLEHLEPIEAREKREKQPWDYSHVPLPTSCLRAWQIHNSNQPASELQIPMGIAAVTFLLPVLATPPWSLLIIELGAPLALAKKACKKMWMNMLWHGYAHFESIEQAAQMERSMGLSFLWPANNGWFVREGEWRWMEHIWGVPWLRSKNAQQKPDFHGFSHISQPAQHASWHPNRWPSLKLPNTWLPCSCDSMRKSWCKRCPLAPALASSFPSLPDQRNQNRQRSTTVDRHGSEPPYRLQDGGNHRGTDAANQHKDHDVLSWVPAHVWGQNDQKFCLKSFLLIIEVWITDSIWIIFVHLPFRILS